MDCSMPGSPVLHCLSWILLKFMSTELVMLSNHLIFYFPLLLSPSISPSFRVFSSGSALCTPISYWVRMPVTATSGHKWSCHLNFTPDFFSLPGAYLLLDSPHIMPLLTYANPSQSWFISLSLHLFVHQTVLAKPRRRPLQSQSCSARYVLKDLSFPVRNYVQSSERNMSFSGLYTSPYSIAWFSSWVLCSFPLCYKRFS